jgi:hypothetical protein
MPIRLDDVGDAAILQAHVSGTLVKEDYKDFVAAFERLVRRHGKVRIFFEMSDFHGWDAGAAWEDLKFGVEHFADVERLAMVGETKWQKAMALFCAPFTKAAVRYFDHAAAAEARTWLSGN